MKKLALLIVMLFAFASFSSCTEAINSDDEAVLEIQATDKTDNCNSTGCGQGGVEDDEDDD